MMIRNEGDTRYVSDLGRLVLHSQTVDIPDDVAERLVQQPEFVRAAPAGRGDAADAGRRSGRTVESR